MSNVIELKRKDVKSEEITKILEELYDLADEYNFNVDRITQKLDKVIHRMEVLSDEYS